VAALAESAFELLIMMPFIYNLQKSRLSMPKVDKLLKKKIRCKDTFLLRCITMGYCTFMINYHIFPECITGQQRENPQ